MYYQHRHKTPPPSTTTTLRYGKPKAHNLITDIHISIMDIHNSIMDIHNCKPIKNKAAIMNIHN